MNKVYLLLLSNVFYFWADSQTTVVITANKDNTIYVENVNGSNGAGISVLAGTTNTSRTRRGLLYFDLPSIPQGSTITAVTLSLYCNKIPTNTFTNTNIQVHKLTGNWGEGTSDAGISGQPATATPNDATWTHKFYATSALWTNAGGDFSPTFSASTPVNAVGPVSYSTTQLVADVQGWVNSSATNFGYMLIASNETSARTARFFDSHESLNIAQRPKISITYTSGALPVKLKSFNASVVNKDVVLVWKTSTETANNYFDIEHSTNGLNFKSIGRINGSGNSNSEHTYSFTHNSITAGKHYYRLAQYDINAQVEFSSIAMVFLRTSIELQIRPNPVTSKIYVEALLKVEGAPYIIQSVAGQVAEKGIISNRILDVGKLSPGLYWLSIEVNKEVFRTSFIKQ